MYLSLTSSTSSSICILERLLFKAVSHFNCFRTTLSSNTVEC